MLLVATGAVLVDNGTELLAGTELGIETDGLDAGTLDGNTGWLELGVGATDELGAALDDPGDDEVPFVEDPALELETGLAGELDGEVDEFGDVAGDE